MMRPWQPRRSRPALVETFVSIVVATATVATAGCSATTAEAPPVAEARADDSAQFVTPWLAPDQRPNRAAAGDVRDDIAVTDEAGRETTLRHLIDRPTILSFFYTRCSNPRKCTQTVNAVARLQSALRDAGIDGQVCVLLMTFDPSFDSPNVMKTYGEARGITFSSTARMIRTQFGPKESLGDYFERLAVDVNFDASGNVNLHGVELLLLDRYSRCVRRYHTVPWTDSAVVADLRQLLAE